MAMGQEANKTKPVALITGAAKRIGAFLAQALARDGYDIVLHYHQSEAEAKALQIKLQALNTPDGLPVKVHLRQADLTDHDALQNIWKDLPQVEVLIHNASSYQRDTLANMQPAQFDAHMHIHLKAPLFMAQAFAAQCGDKSGKILLLSDSSYGQSISPEFFSYAASKLALSSITDLLASALAPNICVNTLALGATLADQIYDEEMFDRIAQKAPLKRTSTPDEIIQAMRMLLHAPGITGQVISLANGLALNAYRHHSEPS
jgi:NAD(P)-dependent dehydrogenase (short-subunit alcohol dehydrogenase family)